MVLFQNTVSVKSHPCMTHTPSGTTDRIPLATASLDAAYVIRTIEFFISGGHANFFVRCG